jgi:hypothetical protein
MSLTFDFVDVTKVCYKIHRYNNHKKRNITGCTESKRYKKRNRAVSRSKKRSRGAGDRKNSKGCNKNRGSCEYETATRRYQ